MKSIKFIMLVSLGFAIYSCEDFLNPLPDSAVVTDTFFESDADVLSGIIGVYDAIQGVNENSESNETRANRGIQFEYLLTEHRTDNTRGATTEGSKADFHRYLLNANNVESEDYYQSMYEVIFRSNNIMAFVPEAADQENQARYFAELKFLRAYAYFNLVRLYGDVPLVTSVVGPSENDLLFSRVSTVQVYDLIIADLQEAINGLDNAFKSRASRAAAQGLLAKVYLTKEDRDYATASQLCQDIINSGDYALESDFSDVFYNELNDEIIFAIQYQVANTLESQSFSSEFTSAVRQGREDGLNILNLNLIADFTAFGGNRSAKSYITIGTSNEVAKFLPEGTDLSTTPPTYGINARNAGNDWIILRYADVLLMHAEATIGANNSTSDAAAIDSYIAVKSRAGFDPIADRPATLTKQALLVERRVELAFENQRFYDLVRFGVADEVLSAHAADLEYGAYDARKLLLPIPSREINLSDGRLGQNPGY